MATLIEPGDNPDLTEERRKATFSVKSMAELIYGGEKKLAKREQIAAFVEATKELHDPKPVEFMTREERYENATRKACNMADHAVAIDALDYEMGHYYSNMELHYGMFLPTIRGQASDEQQEKWLPQALQRAMVGTYAQTELGHGTNLRKLETTATYDPKTQEFVLHSPTVTASKWWPGGLGKTSNHAVVIAQLWTLGKCYGTHPFMVQIRDMDTHQPMPGIKVGDIGPKLGFNANDNGYLIFDHARIPRENMLMRNSQVLPNGEYVKPAHPKLGYGTMVYVRSMMIGDQGMGLGLGATIAIRYAAIRRQGEMIEGQGEVKILDYQTQQYRLFPQLAKAYAFWFASAKVRDMYKKNLRQTKEGNLTLLPELHALSSGLKAVVTWEVAQGIEQCRLACGGHGYSQASGFPDLYGFTVSGSTYEGENIVLLLQVARFLVKAAKQVRAGEASHLAEIADYLGVVGPKHSAFDQSYDFSNKAVIEGFEHVARRQVFDAVDTLDRLRAEGVSPEDAWNRTSVQLCKASRAHVRLYIVKTFLTTVDDVSEMTLKKVLRDVARLFVLNTMNDCAFAFAQDGYMTAQQIEYVKTGLFASLAALRPNAVALVDSLNFNDRELHSVLGRRDGIVYPNLLKWAEQSEINQLQVLPAFHKHLGPMMKNGRSKL